MCVCVREVQNAIECDILLSRDVCGTCRARHQHRGIQNI